MASAKKLSLSSSDFVLQVCAFLRYFPAFIITCSDTGPKHHETGSSFMILQFLDSRNGIRKWHKKYSQKTISYTFQSHKWICRTEIWLPRCWSLLEFIRTSAVSYVASFDVKDKTRVCLVFGGRGFTCNEHSQACGAESSP